jgi:hypothetical protein
MYPLVTSFTKIKACGTSNEGSEMTRSKVVSRKDMGGNGGSLFEPCGIPVGIANHQA